MLNFTCNSPPNLKSESVPFADIVYCSMIDYVNKWWIHAFSQLLFYNCE